MSEPVSIQLFASHCPRNDFFLDRIREAAAQLGLACTLEKITEEDAIARAGLSVTCLESYCPGCRAQHAGQPPEDRCTPALMIDGVLVSWNVPPDDELLRKLLAQHL